MYSAQRINQAFEQLREEEVDQTFLLVMANSKPIIELKESLEALFAYKQGSIQNDFIAALVMVGFRAGMIYQQDE